MTKVGDVKSLGAYMGWKEDVILHMKEQLAINGYVDSRLAKINRLLDFKCASRFKEQFASILSCGVGQRINVSKRGGSFLLHGGRKRAKFQ